LEGCLEHLENIITNNVPILFEEDAMENIWSRGFVWLHRVEGIKRFFFGDWRG
jgi:hypothetical protein